MGERKEGGRGKKGRKERIVTFPGSFFWGGKRREGGDREKRGEEKRSQVSYNVSKELAFLGGGLGGKGGGERGKKKKKRGNKFDRLSVKMSGPPSRGGRGEKKKEKKGGELYMPFVCWSWGANGSLGRRKRGGDERAKAVSLDGCCIPSGKGGEGERKGRCSLLSWGAKVLDGGGGGREDKKKKKGGEWSACLHSLHIPQFFPTEKGRGRMEKEVKNGGKKRKKRGGRGGHLSHSLGHLEKRGRKKRKEEQEGERGCQPGLVCASLCFFRRCIASRWGGGGGTGREGGNVYA